MAPKYTIEEKKALLEAVYEHRHLLLESNSLRYSDANAARKVAWQDVVEYVERETSRKTSRERCKTLLGQTIGKLSQLARDYWQFHNKTGNEVDLDEEEALEDRYTALTDQERMIYDEYRETKGWIGMTSSGDTLADKYTRVSSRGRGEEKNRSTSPEVLMQDDRGDEWRREDDEQFRDQYEDDLWGTDWGGVDANNQFDRSPRQFPHNSGSHPSSSRPSRLMESAFAQGTGKRHPYKIMDASPTKRARVAESRSEFTSFLKSRGLAAKGQQNATKQAQAAPQPPSMTVSNAPKAAVPQSSNNPGFSAPKVIKEREEMRRYEATERSIRMQSLANLQQEHELLLKQREVMGEMCLMARKTVQYIDSHSGGGVQNRKEMVDECFQVGDGQISDTDLIVSDQTMGRLAPPAPIPHRNNDTYSTQSASVYSSEY